MARREEKDHIGFDPIKWIERLRDVNAGSQFTDRERAIIDDAFMAMELRLQRG